MILIEGLNSWMNKGLLGKLLNVVDNDYFYIVKR